MCHRSFSSGSLYLVSVCLVILIGIFLFWFWNFSSVTLVKKYLLCIWSELLLLLYLLLMFWTFKIIPDFLDVLYWIFVYLNFTFLWQSCSFFYVIKTWHSLFQSFNMLMRFLLTSRGFFVLTFILVYLFFSVSSSLLNSICLALIVFLISFNCLSYYDLHWGNYLYFFLRFLNIFIIAM